MKYPRRIKMSETDNGPFYFDVNERIRALEESNTLLRAEMNKLEDENSTLRHRMSLRDEHSKLFEQCEVMRKAIDANIHRMSEIEKMIVALEGL